MAANRKKVCCVRDCPAVDVEGLAYFTLPLDIEKREKWLYIIGRPDLNYEGLDPKSHAVCSVHFDSSHKGMVRQLQPDVVPTKNVPRKRKGILIFSSTTASQTDLPYSDDEEDEENESKKGKLEDNVKYSRFSEDVAYRKMKGNRKLFMCCSECAIDGSIDKSIPDDIVIDLPSYSLICSENLPRDPLSIGNRKMFVFNDDENDKEDDISENITKVSHAKVVPSSNDVTSNIVISSVVSLNEDFATMNNFFLWRDKIIDKQKEAKYEDFKLFALHLHTINTRVYRLLMDVWQLPNERELKDIQLKIGPRFDDQMTKLLTQKFKLLSNEGKFCTLGLDIMKLKPQFYYETASDEIIGVHNVNGVRNKMAASYALVAMVRGIKVSWSQVVAFSLLSTMTDTESIQAFLTSVLVKLKRMNLKVIGVVMGDDPFFWKYCRSKHFISPTLTYISIDKEKYNVIFDIPSVLNMLKNYFINNDFIFENQTVSWKYVKQVYELDIERGGTLLSQLSEGHMNLDYGKKKPEYLSQVFSRAVSAAMSFYIDHGLMESDAIPTSEFIKRISEAFDVLNTTKLSKLSHKKSIDLQLKLRARAQSKALEDLSFMFRKLRTIKNGDEDNEKQDGLKYFVISLRSLILIAVDLRDNFDLNGIDQTRLCYLERMEELFKSIQEYAKTLKPTPVQFSRSFSKQFLENLVEMTPPPKSIGNMHDFLNMADSINVCQETYEGKICLKDKDYRFKLPKEYAIIYLASYLIYKCYKMHACEALEKYYKNLVDLNKTKIYIHFEGLNRETAFYDHLKLPAFEFVSFLEKLDGRFLTAFDEFYHSYPAERIFESLTLVPRMEVPPCPCFPMGYMLILLTRTRLYQTVMQNTKCLRNRPESDESYELEVKKL